MKISLFDVTDMNNPIEKFTEYIGDRGTYSEILHNHRALLFSKEKSLLAFPVSLYEVTANSRNNHNSNWGPPHGEFKTQGAFVYNIDLETGFTLRGAISHLGTDPINSEWRRNDFVKRILYIGDMFYTVSDGQIRANDMKDLSLKGSVNLN
jgi:uncharacterized secreted protein with C-terminal beta-propeller domain